MRYAEAIQLVATPVQMPDAASEESGIACFAATAWNSNTLPIRRFLGHEVFAEGEGWIWCVGVHFIFYPEAMQ